MGPEVGPTKRGVHLVYTITCTHSKALVLTIDNEIFFANLKKNSRGYWLRLPHTFLQGEQEIQYNKRQTYLTLFKACYT